MIEQRVSEESLLERQDSGFKTLTPEQQSITKQTQNHLDQQNFKQNPHEHSTKVNFNDLFNEQRSYDNHGLIMDNEKGHSTNATSPQKPEKGILSKFKSREAENMGTRMDNVVNEVFVEKRPKLKRQESILTMSGFIIGGITEEEETVGAKRDFDSHSDVSAFENESR